MHWILKLLITIVLMVISMPVVGTILGLGFGFKAEKFVYPLVLIAWGIVIYIMWFH